MKVLQRVVYANLPSRNFLRFSGLATTQNQTGWFVTSLEYLRLIMYMNISWEPQANVESCTELLKRFWKHIGLDDEDYPAGHVCEAKQSWISMRPIHHCFLFPLKLIAAEKEKKMFANNFPEVLHTQKQRAKAEKAAKVRIFVCLNPYSRHYKCVHLPAPSL